MYPILFWRHLTPPSCVLLVSDLEPCFPALSRCVVSLLLHSHCWAESGWRRNSPPSHPSCRRRVPDPARRLPGRRLNIVATLKPATVFSTAFSIRRRRPEPGLS